MGHRRKCVSKSFFRRMSVTFGCPEHKGVSSRHVSERRKKLGRVVQTETEECIDQTAGTRSADYLRFLAEVEMRAADPDEYLDMDDSDVDDFEIVPGRNAAVLTCAGVHLEDNPVSPSAKRARKIPPLVSQISTQPDIEMGTVSLPVPEDAMEVGFDAGVEPALVRRGANRVSAMWEGRASTLRTRTMQSVINRMMSKCRTRQLESCDTLSAFFHAWLERGVRLEPPKDPRLSDGWRWQLARAFFLLSNGVSTEWMPGSARMATDAMNLAGLSEVKGLKSSSRPVAVGSALC